MGLNITLYDVSESQIGWSVALNDVLVHETYFYQPPSPNVSGTIHHPIMSQWISHKRESKTTTTTGSRVLSARRHFLASRSQQQFDKSKETQLIFNQTFLLPNSTYFFDFSILSTFGDASQIVSGEFQTLA